MRAEVVAMTGENLDMDAIKTGRLIRRLRQENAMTQLQLARQLHISDKTVSKWERGVSHN